MSFQNLSAHAGAAVNTGRGRRGPGGSTRSWKLLQRLVIVLSNRARLFMLGLVWGVDLKTSFFLQMCMRACERARERNILTEHSLHTVNFARVEGTVSAFMNLKLCRHHSSASRRHKTPRRPSSAPGDHEATSCRFAFSGCLVQLASGRRGL